MWPTSNTCRGRFWSKVKKLVISTRAEIGRNPIAFSRACNHAGDGPFFTPRITRPANRGQPFSFNAGSIVTVTGEAKVPVTGSTTCGFNLPKPRAAKSRAMPRTPSASGRFGVILM
ncbi:hypothetical protein GALL_520440 [mine drainage metagenome]|uniref:Uncharacterized protein n=1 Tax=mine drainage metagenome TaxID=410659 RepID=A0A1J5P5C6_9ZZZZ